MKLLITRPEETSQKLAELLLKLGHEIVISPLITIHYRPVNSLDLEGVQAFVVTSANGVTGLSHATDNRSLPLYAVGNQTAETAKTAGFREVHSANGDVGNLAARLVASVKPENGTLLHAGGARLAGDLKRRLKAENFQYRREVLYDAVDTMSLAPEAREALVEGTLDGVLLFSPHTAGVFKTVIEQQGLASYLKGVTAWCLSQNVAHEIAGLPFKESLIADQPTAKGLLASIPGSAVITDGKEDGTGEHIVSDTPKKDRDNQEKPVIGEGDTSAPETVVEDAGIGVNKPLPDSLTGKGGAFVPENEKPARSNTSRIILALFVVFCLGVAAWPILYPKVSAFLPQNTRNIIQGYMGSVAETKEIEGRLAALERAQASQPLTTEAPNLGPLQSALNENQDLVASLNGKLNDLAEKLDLETTKLSDRLQSEEEQSNAVAAALKAMQAEILKTQTAVKAVKDTGAVRPSDESSVAVSEPAMAEPDPEMQATLNRMQTALDQVKTELAAVQQGLTASGADVAAQKDQIGALSTALESRIEQETARNADGDETLVLLALGQLHRETRTDQSFAGALQQAIAVSPQAMQADLAVLGTVSKTGALLQQKLTSDFVSIANDITQASRLPTSETWYGKTLHNIAGLVKFRRVGSVDGDSVDARVARAENKLQMNDLAGAVAELKPLDGAAAEVAAPWIAKAEARLLVDQSITSLLNRATTAAVQETGTSN